MRGIAGIFALIPVLFLSILVFSVASNLGTETYKEPHTVERQEVPTPSPTIVVQAEKAAKKEEPTPTPAPEINSTIVFSIVPTPTPTPTPKPTNVTTGSNYTVVTYDLGSISVVTDSANDDDCGNNCPAKPLAQYVSENGGRAGINGTYFCPPDYSWCGGKVNTYDFPVWNNRKKKWMRADTLFWNGRGMMVFRGGSAQFYPCAACVGAPSDITGGIVNYPSLLSGGNIVLDEGSLTDNLRVTKGTRAGIGFGGGKLFLVVARSSNMRDLANIFKALGATDALNLDGGGSAALYNGGYRAGPGRLLPNAVIIK